MAMRIAEDGYLQAGYDQGNPSRKYTLTYTYTNSHTYTHTHTVSIDDCWANMERDPTTQRLVGNTTRFPSGIKALGDFMHSKNVRFGIYNDEGTKTCAGYPGSKGYETIDADTFKDWGVDYLKLDGCYNDPVGYSQGYPAFGSALQSSGRDIVYSCSWPAYLGDNETSKPFQDMIDGGCNLWRNWADINNEWSSLLSIIDHWGDFCHSLKPYSAPGHWHDMDMLLVGDDHYNKTLSVDQARTQMTIWSLMASPLIIAADLRTIKAEYRDILLNPEVIAIDQDSLGEMGLRLTPKAALGGEIWARNLSDGSMAMALFNRGDQVQAKCPNWNITKNGYHDDGENLKCAQWDSLDDMKNECCQNPACYEFSASNDGKNPISGCLKPKAGEDAPFVQTSGYDGWQRLDVPPPSEDMEISFELSDLGFPASEWDSAMLRDLWSRKDSGVVKRGEKRKESVVAMGVKFFKVSKQ